MECLELRIWAVVHSYESEGVWFSFEDHEDSDRLFATESSAWAYKDELDAADQDQWLKWENERIEFELRQKAAAAILEANGLDSAGVLRIGYAKPREFTSSYKVVSLEVAE